MPNELTEEEIEALDFCVNEAHTELVSRARSMDYFQRKSARRVIAEARSALAKLRQPVDETKESDAAKDCFNRIYPNHASSQVRLTFVDGWLQRARAKVAK